MSCFTSRITRGFASLLVVLCLRAGPAAAEPITLDKLVAGQTIQCGGLVFSNFEYGNLSGAGMAAASDIKVTCVMNGGEVGLHFEGTWASANGINGGFDNARLAYTVTAPQSTPLSDGQLIGNFDATGLKEGFGKINETFFSLMNGCPT
jgi:hypothetical protein